MMNKPVRFLLVEDDDDHAELITLGLLAQKGVPKIVDRMRDGAEAIAYLLRSGADRQCPRPGVILLDLKLPKVSGCEVLAAVKSDPGLRTIPVVVLSTSRAPEDRAEAYAHHANSYLTKPTSFGEFSQMIEDLSAYWAGWNQLPAEECTATRPGDASAFDSTSLRETTPTAACR
ncbi:MAG TPA: response regulator [Phycisphaerae bacterium]|nr:response regulator [Phycisphaerae bacterium]